MSACEQIKTLSLLHFSFFLALHETNDPMVVVEKRNSKGSYQMKLLDAPSSRRSFLCDVVARSYDKGASI